MCLSLASACVSNLLVFASIPVFAAPTETAPPPSFSPLLTSQPSLPGGGPCASSRSGPSLSRPRQSPPVRASPVDPAVLHPPWLCDNGVLTGQPALRIDRSLGLAAPATAAFSAAAAERQRQVHRLRCPRLHAVCVGRDGRWLHVRGQGGLAAIRRRRRSGAQRAGRVLSGRNRISHRVRRLLRSCHPFHRRRQGGCPGRVA